MNTIINLVMTAAVCFLGCEVQNEWTEAQAQQATCMMQQDNTIIAVEKSNELLLETPSDEN